MFLIHSELLPSLWIYDLYDHHSSPCHQRQSPTDLFSLSPLPQFIFYILTKVYLKLVVLYNISMHLEFSGPCICLQASNLSSSLHILQQHGIFLDFWNKSCLFPYLHFWLECSYLSYLTSHHSFNKDLWSTCYVPSTVLGSVLTIVKAHPWSFHRACVLVSDILRIHKSWS